MSRKATIRDVAQKAGVSTQTISRVVNGRPDVSIDTRLKVQQAIIELDYHPNSIARSLITRQSKTLGIAVSGIEFFGPSSMLVGIEEEANLLGYSLSLNLVHEADNEDLTSAYHQLNDRQVDGIIWAVPPICHNREKLLKQSRLSGTPIIFLNAPEADISVVSIDNRSGAVLAVRHLLAQGYQKIGLISGPLNWWEAQERKSGWESVLGCDPQGSAPKSISVGDWTAAGGEAAFANLYQQYPDMDGVFVANDQMALGVLKFAQEAQIRIPEQLGVIGFDDCPESAYFSPALSTIRQPLKELGAAAVREISLMIRTHYDKKGEYEPKTITLQPRLIPRSSSIRSNSSKG